MILKSYGCLRGWKANECLDSFRRYRLEDDLASKRVPRKSLENAILMIPQPSGVELLIRLVIMQVNGVVNNLQVFNARANKTIP